MWMSQGGGKPGGRKTGGRVRWSVWKEEGEKRTSKSNRQTQP